MQTLEGQGHQKGTVSLLKPLSTIQVMVAHASIASSKPKVELDLHADTCI